MEEEKKTQIIQYRDNAAVRYFIDTEFYEDGKTIDLISIAVVADDGREFYAVSLEAELHRVSPWVRENVVKQLPAHSDPAWMTREQIRKGLTELLRPGELTEIWGYYADYDWIVLCQLFGTMMQLPNHFPRYCLDLKQLSWLVGNPKHPKQKDGLHNALSDARYQRELYWYLRSVPSGVWGYDPERKS